MGPESGLDTKTSPAKTTRSPPERDRGNETIGVCQKTIIPTLISP